MKKKIIAAAAALAAVMGFSACSDKEATPEISADDLSAKIMEAVEFPDMAEIESDRLDDFYDINSENIEEMSFYICGSGAYPDELAVFKMKTEDEAKTVAELFKARKEKQTETFKDYTPKEMYKFDDALVGNKGRLVYYVVSADNAEAKKIINDSK